jgi:enoyl-CoA hydratase
VSHVSEAPEQPAVLVERTGRVVRLTLNRPDKLNSISPEVVSLLDSALDGLRNDDRCLVITGAGRAFCAGGDLDAVMALANGETDVISAFHLSITRVLRRIEQLPIPVVCAVNGIAVAGGLEIAAACDIVVADERARFGDGHAVYGLLPGGGGSVRLPRIIGAKRAKLLMMTGRQVSARTMEQWGLVDIVAAPGELEAAVESVVGELVQRSPLGLSRMKHLVDAGLELSTDEAIDLEQRVTSEHTLSTDYAEGLAAFREKRLPVFEDRLEDR